MSTPTKPARHALHVPTVPGYFAARYRPEQREALLESIADKALPYPLSERDKSRRDRVHVTFLWHNQQAVDASAVILSANALVEEHTVGDCEFERIDADLWALTLFMPSDWTASYRITVHTGTQPPPWRTATDRRQVRLCADAGGIDRLNPRQGTGMSGAPVSIYYGPDAVVPAYLEPATPAVNHRGSAIGGQGADLSANQIISHPRLKAYDLPDAACSRTRRVWMYEPPAAALHAHRTTPLVIVHDGATWVKYLAMARTLDGAISSGALAGVHVAFIDSGTLEQRGCELPVVSGTTTWLVEQFLPWVRQNYPVTAAAEHTVVAGSSYGGLAALLAVTSFPEHIATAVAQSPSLWHTDLRRQCAQLDPRVRITLQAGVYEHGILQACEQTMQAVKDTSAEAQIDFHTVSGGHDWAWWAPRLMLSLCHLHPGASGIGQP